MGIYVSLKGKNVTCVVHNFLTEQVTCNGLSVIPTYRVSTTFGISSVISSKYMYDVSGHQDLIRSALYICMGIYVSLKVGDVTCVVHNFLTGQITCAKGHQFDSHLQNSHLPFGVRSGMSSKYMTA